MTASTVCQLQNQLPLAASQQITRLSPCLGIIGRATHALLVIAWFALRKGAAALPSEIFVPGCLYGHLVGLVR
jgi:hypothetical protein